MKKTARILCIFFVAVVIFFAFSICLRFAVRNVLLEKLGISNVFTDIVLFDDSELRNNNLENVEGVSDSVSKIIEIDWAERYPFVNSRTGENVNGIKYNSVFDRYISVVDSIKDKLERYATEHLMFYSKFTEFSNTYKQILGWNISALSEYNNIQEAEYNYFYGPMADIDLTESIAATKELSDFCKSKDIDFLYIQYPGKISKYSDSEINNLLDYSNSNCDKMILGLKVNGVDSLDIRETISNCNLDHHSLFYNTDHHWKAETGLKTAGWILEYLKNSYGYNVDPTKLDEINFDFMIYPKCFLGSEGKKITLSRAIPDDFTVIFPKYETLLRYVLPTRSIDTIGDFSITYGHNLETIGEKDYYKKNQYGVYDHADEPYIEIENLFSDNDLSVVIIHDSFSNCVIPFMALQVNHIYELDLRYFNGSVKTFIESEHPDMVIVAYNPTLLNETINYDKYNDPFDFR